MAERSDQGRCVYVRVCVRVRVRVVCMMGGGGARVILRA